MEWRYWTTYWWMLPVGVPICATACAASVEGATMFAPLFALGFPLLGVPALTPGQAIATALIIEVVGYSSGLAGHARQRTVVWPRVASLAAVSAPVAAAAAAIAHRLPGAYLLLGVAAVLLVLGPLLWESASREWAESRAALPPKLPAGEGVAVRARDGLLYHCPPDGHPAVTRLLTVLGGALTGLVGMGIGEVTSGQFMLRLRWPARVAIGTGVGVVLPTVVTASVVQVALLPRAGLGLPWNLVVWVVPAVLLGGQLGSRLTGLVPERRLKQGVSVLFILLAGIVAASTLRRLAG